MLLKLTPCVDGPLAIRVGGLIRQMDVNRGKKIMVGEKVDKPFWLLEVFGTYPLFNPLQELKRASDKGAKSIREI